MSHSIPGGAHHLLSPSHATPASQPSSPSSLPSRIVTVPQNASQNNLTGLVISKIEDIFTSMIDTLADGSGSLSIPYRSRNSPRQPLGALRFPGNSVQEATKFTRMIRIMELAREALVSGHLITKRNIYYQNPDLFNNQGNVDQLVDDLAYTLRVGRDALNIVAASKGLLAGPLRLIMENHSVISCVSGFDEKISIPPIAMVRQIDFGETRWVLVVEKEGKGYADLATLRFLNLIHSLRPIIPILCVVDCDPHGIDIMRTYKYGSRNLSHEENATVSGLQWLGVKMEDILGHSLGPWEANCSRIPAGHPSQLYTGNFSSQDSGSSLMSAPQAAQVQSRPQHARDSLTPLTATDRRTAQRMFKAMVDGDRELDHEETEQLRELQVMLMLNMKAEIQAIDTMGDLSHWLDDKIGIA
ncbi:hypothetical protein VPNG_05798 [Cytospora leucostoma]|uniref:DNA topoisomerase (ATP-hydrolyzing) n=1 Tax=Cytospora leucostoma TaxID=1230097 RepID=A0A423X0M8_9PEZI|nr:hypothetical protein VPNG_05798 [Cytospora leucostoma]